MMLTTPRALPTAIAVGSALTVSPGQQTRLWKLNRSKLASYANSNGFETTLDSILVEAQFKLADIGKLDEDIESLRQQIMAMPSGGKEARGQQKQLWTRYDAKNVALFRKQKDLDGIRQALNNLRDAFTGSWWNQLEEDEDRVALASRVRAKRRREARQRRQANRSKGASSVPEKPKRRTSALLEALEKKRALPLGASRNRDGGSGDDDKQRLLFWRFDYDDADTLETRQAIERISTLKALGISTDRYGTGS